jgi:RHS repeat-associated protein
VSATEADGFAIGRQPPGQASTTFINQIGYSPFGPVVSWRQAASNKYYRRSFDRDGRISGIASSTGNVLSYAFDAGSRITRITESGRADKTFSYDRNNRLTRYVDGASTIAYAYDASGNRISDDDFSYAIASTSNRIASRTPIGSSTAQTLFYDAAGGMENNGLFQLRYDERNRLDRVIVGALTTTYGVKGLGERVAKDGQQAFGKVEFVYGLSGGLLGQYNASGAAAEEIVWLGDLPVGTIQGGAAYHIAPDHLGAPHQIVNSANGQVWFWNHDPFGNGAPTAAAGFAHRLRFPGQVYDAESGLHSNGHRDYDPRLGRYVESDPIGLAGGNNTYAYAGNDPVNAIDPLGLDPKSNDDDAEALPEIDIEVIEAGVFGKLLNRLLSREARDVVKKDAGDASKYLPGISSKISQKQMRHIAGRREYRGGGYLNNIDDAQAVLDAYHAGRATILGKTLRSGSPVVRVEGVTGTNVNIGAGFANQPTNVFIIKGTENPSVVPTNPNWRPR